MSFDWEVSSPENTSVFRSWQRYKTLLSKGTLNPCSFPFALGFHDVGVRETFPMFDDTPSLQLSSSTSFTNFFACQQPAIASNGEYDDSVTKSFVPSDSSDTVKALPLLLTSDASVECEISEMSTTNSYPATWSTKPFSTHSSSGSWYLPLNLWDTKFFYWKFDFSAPFFIKPRLYKFLKLIWI